MQSSSSARKYFFLPVNTGFVDNGVVDERGRAFYRARSGYGLHCTIVGNVVIPNGFASNEVCAEISADRRWGDLAREIASVGALPGIQLSSACPGYRGMRRFVHRRDEDGLQPYRDMARSISAQQVQRIFDSLRRGTELAIGAGFRHVQLHAAHGYLFNLLIDPRLSPHFDKAIRAVADWTADLASTHIESSVRISLRSGAPELDGVSGAAFMDAICSLPVTYIDASAGFYNIDKRLIYPSNPELIECRVDATLKLAERNSGKHFILSGKSARAWDDELPINVHIGVCRDLIANPNFMRDRSDGCMSCMKCHYYSRGAPHLTCGRWSDSDR